MYLNLYRWDLSCLYLASCSEQSMADTPPVSCRKHGFSHSCCCAVCPQDTSSCEVACQRWLEIWFAPVMGCVSRPSLAVQWSRLHVPTQGLQVPSLVGKPGSHVPWGQKQNETSSRRDVVANSILFKGSASKNLKDGKEQCRCEHSVNTPSESHMCVHIPPTQR